jgi:hypothetical protein
VVGGLLGVVDDVVDRRRQVVDLRRLERRPLAGALVQPVDDVVGDAVPLLLGQQDVARQLGSLRVVCDHLAQEDARALGMRPDCSKRARISSSLRRASQAIPRRH